MNNNAMINLKKKNDHGFTLIELLVVIAILAAVSGMFVLAYRGAQQESNLQKTRGTIQKINEVINSRMQEYESYPVPLGISATASPAAGGSKPALIDRARLLMLRDIIRTEMPDHPDDLKATRYWTNISNPPVVIRPVQTGLFDGGFPVLVPRTNILPVGLTSRASALYSRLASTISVLVDEPWDKTNSNAELLYLIVEASELDGSSAIELFGSSEIGDTDNDGLNEFLDAYGNPIRWIRWPSGYPALARSYPDMLDFSIVDSSGNLTLDSEPADRIKADPGWRASDAALRPGIYPLPLIVSAGQDGYFGLNFREIDRYSPAGTPRWPVAAPTSYSVSDLPFPEPPTYVVGPYRIPDPWGPRLEPSMRMGALLVRPIMNGRSVAGPYDPKEGGAIAANEPDAKLDPVRASSDNLSNYEGATISL